MIVEVAVDPIHLDLGDLEATRIQEIGVEEKVYLHLIYMKIYIYKKKHENNVLT